MTPGSAFRGALAGFDQAAGAPEAAQPLLARNEEDRQNQLKVKTAPLSQALQADQVRLAAFTDPKTGHALPGHEEDYEHVMANMQNTIGQMRTLLGDKSPTAGVLDRLHIRRDLHDRVQNWNKQNQQTTQAYATGAVPFEMTPEGQKAAYQRETQIEAAKAHYSPSLKLYKLPNGESHYFDAKNPDEIPEGAQPVSITAGNPKRVMIDGPNGPQFAFQEGEQFFDQNHNPIQNAKPYQKPPVLQPKQGTSKQGGGNVFATLTPQGWKDSNTGQILTDFRPMPTFAQTGLYEPTMSMDDQTGQITFGVFNRRNGQTKITGTSNRPIPNAVVTNISKNMEEGLAANNRYRTMIGSEKAARAGDQQAQLNILSQHLGMTQGAQRGARISQAMWNEAMASAPWLQSKAAQWFHDDPETGDKVFDGFKGGVNLTPDQITQMISLGKQRRDIQWQQVKEAGQFYGINLDTSQFDQPETPEGPKTQNLRSAQKGSPPSQKHKVGDLVMQGGHKFKVTAVDAQGKVTAADPLP